MFKDFVFLSIVTQRDNQSNAWKQLEDIGVYKDLEIDPFRLEKSKRGFNKDRKATEQAD